MLLNITIDMRFEGFEDEVLAEMLSTIREEQKRRFMSTWDQYPKILACESMNSAQATKRYREAYNVSLSQAHWLYTRDYSD